MGPGEIMFIALVAIGLPIIAVSVILLRWMKIKERRMEIEAHVAAERAAQYAVSNVELEARVRVLEKIVTDGGLETAGQIEALRTPRLASGVKVQ